MSGARVPSPALAVADGASAVVTAQGEVQCLVGSRAFALDGANAELVRATLAAADGTRSAEELTELLSPHFESAATRVVVAALLEVGVLIPRAMPIPRDNTRVLVLGNGALLAALTNALVQAGHENPTRVRLTNAALASVAKHSLSPLPSEPAQPCDRLLEGASPADFRDAFVGFELVLCALEGVPYQTLLAVNQAALAAAIPCLFVTPSAIGPLVRPGDGACFGCRLLSELGASESVPWFLSPALTPDSDSRATLIANAAIAQLCAPERSVSTLRFEANGATRSEPLLPHGDCPACSRAAEGALADTLAASVQIGRSWPVSPQGGRPDNPKGFRRVGIVGGGTAGFLTALALRKLRPELEVTLIESSQIPVIGVGEATTPELVKFLHSPRFLDRGVADLFERVRPTWKLGIKFQWGPEDFTFPFQRGRLLESKAYEGQINDQSLGALLMMADKAPVFRDEHGRNTSHLHLVRWAYHLENRRFVRYLHEEAQALGVTLVDARLNGVERSSDGGSVSALVADDGRKFEFDLYVDCSGFRSLLLENTLGSPFTDWSSTLFNDRAVIATVPHDGTVKPYTLAETMDAGWCWNIPFEDEDHRGYVFSSRFLSPEQAEAEMRAKNPSMGQAGLVKFRSGRHDEFWKSNVIAIGNSYGFVEPLESTAIHMIVLTLELLTTHFPESREDQATIDTLNRKVAARWDALRWFLGAHYRFNQRLDTEYWRTARGEADISGAEERVALFRARAPLSYRSSLFYTVFPPEYFSDDHSFDTLLMGQDVPASYLLPVEDRRTWNRRRSTLHKMQRAALPQAQALTWLREERPDLLESLKDSPESWLYGWVPA